MQIPKIRRLSKSKDLSDIMKIENLSLSVTFVYIYENYLTLIPCQSMLYYIYNT